MSFIQKGFKKRFELEEKKNHFMTGTFQVPFLPVCLRSLAWCKISTFPHITQGKFPSQDPLIKWVHQ